jgi:hypothetical protein
VAGAGVPPVSGTWRTTGALGTVTTSTGGCVCGVVLGSCVAGTEPVASTGVLTGGEGVGVGVGVVVGGGVVLVGSLGVGLGVGGGVAGAPVPVVAVAGSSVVSVVTSVTWVVLWGSLGLAVGIAGAGALVTGEVATAGTTAAAADGVAGLTWWCTRCARRAAVAAWRPAEAPGLLGWASSRTTVGALA